MPQNSTPPLLRVNRISLGPLERRVVPWLAQRLPAWVLPDHLTGLGLFAALLIGLSYWLTRYSLDWLWLGNAALLLHWYADSLDGTLARVRHIERERYGFFVDHYSDTVAVFLMCLGMGLSPIMDLRIALLLIVAYYAMMMLVYLVSLARDVFKISFAGLGPTEVRLAMVLANIVVWALDNPSLNVIGHRLTLFSLCGLFVTALLSIFYLIFGERERRKLAQLDPQPCAERDRSVPHQSPTPVNASRLDSELVAGGSQDCSQ
jgi:archaetidylinositol phosphate synthase